MSNDAGKTSRSDETGFMKNEEEHLNNALPRFLSFAAPTAVARNDQLSLAVKLAFVTSPDSVISIDGGSNIVPFANGVIVYVFPVGRP